MEGEGEDEVEEAEDVLGIGLVDRIGETVVLLEEVEIDTSGVDIVVGGVSTSVCIVEVGVSDPIYVDVVITTVTKPCRFTIILCGLPNTISVTGPSARTQYILRLARISHVQTLKPARTLVPPASSELGLMRFF
jgi:hypothetical protein